MAIQKEFNDTQNFTGRARIKQKNDLFFLQLLDQKDSTARIHIKFDRSAIIKECKLKNEGEMDFVLDVYVLGEIHRFVLTPYRSEDELEVPNVPEDANLEFRLKVISRSDTTTGKILAATGGRIRLHTGNGEDAFGEKNTGIFHPKPSRAIGDRIWMVRWDDGQGDFDVLVNADYLHKFIKDPLFAAHVFPEIVRNIATGILFRNEDIKHIEEDTLAFKWKIFIQQSLQMPLEGEDAEHLKDADNTAKLDYVENIVEAFANQKWRDGKSLLEEIL